MSGARALRPTRAAGGRADGLTTRGQSFLTCGLVLLVCGWALGLGDLVRLGLLLLALTLVAVVGARRNDGSLHVTRRVDPQVLTAGSSAVVTLVATPSGTRPTGTMTATEMLPRSVGDRPRMLIAPMQPGETRTVRYEVAPRRRGVLRLGPLAVQARDGFGLATRFVAAGPAGSVVVLPRVVDLGAAPAALVGAGGGEGTASGVALSGSEDVSVRPYRDGDELRRIHWKATAHTGELMVRQEERPSRRQAVVLLDSRERAHHGHEETSTFEWAVVAVASVVTHLRAEGYEVELVCDGVLEDRLPPGPDTGPGPVDVSDPIAVLAAAQTGDDDDFTRCVRAVDDRSTAGAVVVAVLGAAADDELLLSTLRHPTTRGIAVVVAPQHGDPTAVEAARALARRGWRAGVAAPTDDVADVWARVTGREGSL